MLRGPRAAWLLAKAELLRGARNRRTWGVRVAALAGGMFILIGLGAARLLHGATPDDFGYFVFYPYPGTPLFHTVKEQGLLPDDWQQRPANHRQSILRLPDLTNDDIAHYYDRFTALRERSYLARYGQDLSDEGRAAVNDRYQHTAATG